MIKYLEGIGWCWIATDDEVSEAVMYAACMRDEGAYAHCESGVEETREAAEEAEHLAHD